MMQFPHCDQRVLHAPGECRWCDGHPEWQELRRAWGIAFSGHIPEGGFISAAGWPGDPGHPAKVVTRIYTLVASDVRTDWPLPCPADFNRPPGAPNDHRRWGRNLPDPEVTWDMDAARRWADAVRAGIQRYRAQGSRSILLRYLVNARDDLL